MGKRNKNKSRVSRNKEKQEEVKKVKLIVDMKEGVVATGDVINEKANIYKWRGIVAFDGPSIHSYYTRIFSREEINSIKDTILCNVGFFKINNQEEQEKMLKRYDENISTCVYRSLYDYDISNDALRGNSKSMEYLRIMLSEPNVKRRKTDTDEIYKQRIIEERRKALEKAGIDITFELSLLNRNKIKDNIQIIKEAIKQKSFAKIKIFGKTFMPKAPKLFKITRPVESKKTPLKYTKKPKQIVPLKLKIDNAKKKYLAKSGQTAALKAKKQKENPTQTIKRSLIASGLIVMAGLGIAYGGMKNDSAVDIQDNLEVDSNIETISDVTYETDIEEQVKEVIQNEIKSQETTPIEVSQKPEVVKKEEVVTVSENEAFEDFVEEEIIEEAVEEESLGFDTTFKINEGKFYQGPGGKGKSGSYSKIKGDLKISIIDVIDAKGNLHVIRAKDGKTIQELENEFGEDAKMYGHVVSADGSRVYGWDDMSNIKNAMNNKNNVHEIEEMER